MGHTLSACPAFTEKALPPVFPAGTVKRIHVNQHIIRENQKTGSRDNVITIQWRGKSYRARQVNINGASQAIYSPDKPLSCGARVWVETTAEVVAVP
jgi:hypothetical protein